MSIFDLKGVLYSCDAKTNEEFREQLKKRQKIVFAIFCMGVLTLAVMVVLMIFQPELMESFRAGFYSGVGTGLIVGSVLGYIKLRQMMKSEETLKEARLSETDEREQEITGKALKATAKMMVAAIYLLLLFCAFLSEETMFVLTLLILVFFIGYLISRKIYSKIL